MRLRVSGILERIRASLFLVPMLAVILAAGLAAASIAIDSRLDQSGARLPLGLTSTVESARSLLSTVAGATITFAAIAFSVSLLIIQQTSSQYSPRVVRTLFRDPFNKRIMALVVGTFTYCLVVLRSVRGAVEKSGSPVIPNLSVAIALLLGIATVLAIVAFIDHSAHFMDVSKILDRVQREAIAQIRREWSDIDANRPPPSLHRQGDPHRHPEPPDQAGHTVRFDRNGWVQQIDIAKLVDCVPDGATIWVDTYPGRYATEGSPACFLSAPPSDVAATEHRIISAIQIGETRTMQQDVSFGLRQLVDVALKALSPGINDPTTAQDAIFHITAVLAELMRRDPPPRHRTGESGGRLVLMHQPTLDDLVRLVFDEVRRAAADKPTVCVYLLEALGLTAEALSSVDLPDRTAMLTEQAQLVVAGCERAALLPTDLRTVQRAFPNRLRAT